MLSVVISLIGIPAGGLYKQKRRAKHWLTDISKTPQMSQDRQWGYYNFTDDKLNVEI